MIEKLIDIFGVLLGAFVAFLALDAALYLLLQNNPY